MLRQLCRSGLVTLVKDAWRAVNWKDIEVWSILIAFATWANLSMLLPGEEYYGPPTMSGYRPLYFRSGFLFYVISMAITVPLMWAFPMLPLYYKFVTFAGILSVGGIIFCIGLFIKGHLAPSPGVFGSSGSPVFDYYWGLELYPRYGFDNIFDLKTIVNSRFGLFLWQAVVLAAWKANYELHLVHYLKVCDDIINHLSITAALHAL